MIIYIKAYKNIKRNTYFKKDIYNVYCLDNILKDDIVKIYTDNKGYVLAKSV